MNPGDLFKCHQNLRMRRRDGNMYDYSGYRGLAIGLYSPIGDRWSVLIDGETCIIYRSDIEYVVQRGHQI
jgi:hypothetical protein